MTGLHLPDRTAEQVDPFRQQLPGAVREIDGEEIGSARDLGSSVAHGVIVMKHVGVRKLTPTYDGDRKLVECA
jgi:hypothetical protein